MNEKAEVEYKNIVNNAWDFYDKNETDMFFYISEYIDTVLRFLELDRRTKPCNFKAG